MSRLVVAIGHVEFTGGNQVLYVVKVQQDADEWEVRRTYSDFRRLRDDVHRVMKDARAHILDDACSREFARELADMNFPSKRLFGSKKDHVVKERAVELHRFLIKLLFLTHTYRKAQKARYDQYVDAVPTHQQAAYAALQNRTQASVTVFYLLRDFLKPNTMKTGVSAHAGDLLGSSSGAVSNASSATAGSGVPGADAEEDDSPRRLIRESKILAMRHSGASSQGKKKSESDSNAPNLLQEADRPRHERNQQQLTHSQSTENPARSRSAAKMTTNSTTSDGPDAATQPEEEEQAAPSGSRSKTLSITSLMEASARPRVEAKSLREQYLHKQPDELSVPEDAAVAFSKQRHYSTPSDDVGEWRGRPNRAVTSGSAVSSTSSAQSELVASSVVSSAPSSSTSTEDVVLVDLTLLATSNSSKDKPEADKKPRSHRSTSHVSDKPHASSSRSRSRAKKGVRRKAASAKDLHVREEERLSRLSTQLTAQTISVNAQRELEKYLSEYSAIMILRYVDRFISKAVTRAPGCYRVNAQQRLVIDSERFLEELESTFTDLPDDFATMFHGAGAAVGPDDCGFPKALDRYVQMKWNSFQGKNVGGSSAKGSGSMASRSSSLVDLRTSGSEDDSDTEYEYEETGGGGYMRAKTTFSNDEESMLQEMIANGTAGREQMLRLRRQLHENGWNRRENPGTRSQRVAEEDDDDSSDSDDEDRARQRLQARQKRRSKRLEAQKSASCVVERYQQEQNARRKDRLSRGPCIGGLV